MACAAACASRTHLVFTGMYCVCAVKGVSVWTRTHSLGNSGEVLQLWWDLLLLQQGHALDFSHLQQVSDSLHGHFAYSGRVLAVL